VVGNTGIDMYTAVVSATGILVFQIFGLGSVPKRASFS
jgi:hypothetical protein